MDKVGIVALGKYLPQRKLTNADLEKIVETTDEWIMSRTGIGERRVAAPGEKTSDLAIKAALVLLSPYTPMLFMGEEYGERAPFPYFIDHGDARLTDVAADDDELVTLAEALRLHVCYRRHA